MRLVSEIIRFRKSEKERGAGKSDIIYLTLSDKLFSNIGSYYSIVNYSCLFLGECLKSDLHDILVFLQNRRDDLFYEKSKTGHYNDYSFLKYTIEDRIPLSKFISIFKYQMNISDKYTIINIRDLKFKIQKRLSQLIESLEQEDKGFFNFRFEKAVPATNYKYDVIFQFRHSVDIDFRKDGDTFYIKWSR